MGAGFCSMRGDMSPAWLQAQLTKQERVKRRRALDTLGECLRRLFPLSPKITLSSLACCVTDPLPLPALSPGRLQRKKNGLVPHRRSANLRRVFAP
jgi:hypothetical protein